MSSLYTNKFALLNLVTGIEDMIGRKLTGYLRSDRKVMNYIYVATKYQIIYDYLVWKNVGKQTLYITEM